MRHEEAALRCPRSNKATPIVMKLVSWKPRAAAFEGPAVGAPGLVRLSYARPSDEALVCTLEKEGKKEEYSFRRAAP